MSDGSPGRGFSGSRPWSRRSLCWGWAHSGSPISARTRPRRLHRSPCPAQTAPPPQFSLVLPGMARDDPGTLVVNSPTARHASDDASSGNSAVAAAGAGGPPAGLAAPPPTAAPTLTATPTAEPTATPTPLPTLDDRPEQGFRSPAEDSGEEADPPPVVTLTPGPPAPQALPPEATPLPEGGS